MKNFVLLSFLTIVIIVSMLSSTPNLYGQTITKNLIDENLISVAMKKGKDLGYNPYAIISLTVSYSSSRRYDVFNFYDGRLDKGGILAGAIRIQNGEITFIEKDMIINVGEVPYSGLGFELLKGEYAVFKNGEFIKQSGKISPY